jgi:KEOPS complex subunit Pcc1
VPHDATLSLSCPDERRATIVYDAVAVEADSMAALNDRSTANIRRDGVTVTVDIDAADHTALRAATNTWCRLLEVAERST